MSVKHEKIKTEMNKIVVLALWRWCKNGWTVAQMAKAKLYAGNATYENCMKSDRISDMVPSRFCHRSQTPMFFALCKCFLLGLCWGLGALSGLGGSNVFFGDRFGLPACGITWLVDIVALNMKMV
jgi:hypothetical protein